MPTPIWLSGWEHGTLPAAVSGGGIYDSIMGVIGTNISVQSTIKRTGQYALRLAPTATVAARQTINISPAVTVVVLRGYVYIETMPTGATPLTLLEVDCVTSANNPRIVLYGNTSELRIYTSSTDHSLLMSGVTTGVWYRINYSVKVAANPWVLKARVDGGTEVTHNSAQAADTLGTMRWGTGSTTGPAAVFYWDDCIYSVTEADHPIAAGQIERLPPVSDGTHATPSSFQDSGNAAINASTNPAFGDLDDVPLPTGTAPTSDFIKQITANTAHYIELSIQDPVSGVASYNGVQGLLAYGGASATANRGGTVVRRSDGTEVEIWGRSAVRQDYSETTVFYKRAVITAPGGGWTQQQISDLVFRVGYSDDVSPVPTWQALMLEYDYTPGAWDNSGALSQTLGAFTSTGSGALPITGALSRTLGGFTSAGAGALPITGALNKTLGPLTVDADGTLPITGSLTQTLGPLTADADGALPITGALARSLDPFTLDADGTVGEAPNSGTLNAVLGAFTVTATGILPITGSLFETLDAFALAASGAEGQAAPFVGERFTQSAINGLALSGAGLVSITVGDE